MGEVAPPGGGFGGGAIGRGIALMLAFTVLAPMMDVLAKLATASLPPAQIALARFAVQGLLLAPFLWRRSAGRWGARPMGLHLMRGLAVAGATVAFMTALREMPLTDALAIVYVEPFFLVLLGALLLGERVGWRRVAACAVGFCGALLVVQPSLRALGPVALLPLLTALLFAIYMILTRMLIAHESALRLQALSGTIGAGVLAGALWAAEGSGDAIWDPVWPSGAGWALSLGVGALATLSHLCLTWALRHAPAATLAPIGYMEIAVAAGLSLLVFGEFPDPLRWLGIGLIAGSGFYVFWRETRTAGRARAVQRDRGRAGRAAPP